jgi:hypothetical protein
MQSHGIHAISNSASLEANHYAAIAKQELADDARQRHSDRCDEILGAFDAKDVMSAIELAGEHSSYKLDALYEALAIIPQLNIANIDDARMMRVAMAFSNIATYYAGHRAAMELGA